MILECQTEGIGMGPPEIVHNPIGSRSFADERTIDMVHPGVHSNVSSTLKAVVLVLLGFLLVVLLRTTVVRWDLHCEMLG